MKKMLSLHPLLLVDCSRAMLTSTQRWGFQSLHQRMLPFLIHTDWTHTCPHAHTHSYRKLEVFLRYIFREYFMLYWPVLQVNCDRKGNERERGQDMQRRTKAGFEARQLR